jgi:hypothetical protein
MQHGTVADQGEVAALAHHPRLAKGERLLVLRDRLAEGPVDSLGLEEDHRVCVADGANQEGSGVTRGGGNNHLESRCVGEEGLLALGVMLRARTPPP